VDEASRLSKCLTVTFGEMWFSIVPRCNAPFESTVSPTIQLYKRFHEGVPGTNPVPKSFES